MFIPQRYKKLSELTDYLPNFYIYHNPASAMQNFVMKKENNMNTWQDMIDNALIASGCISQAAIIGLDGTVWAYSAGCDITLAELSSLPQVFTDSGYLPRNLYINKKKYLVAKSEDRSLYAKYAKTGVVLVKTTQAVIIGFHEEEVTPSNAYKVVEEQANYLIASGY